jgi:phosphoribosylanthranilate isomerase
MTRIKMCGITNYDDAYAAAKAGAHMLGFIFYKQSPRKVEPDDALTICRRLRAEMGEACPALVGVFVNEGVGRISMTLEKVGIRIAQLSGDESVDLLRELRGIGYKAIRPRGKGEALDDAAYFQPNFPTDAALPSLLVDAYQTGMYGGTGELASLETAQALKAAVPRLLLAGGLTPDNVGEIVRAVRPWGVDVASGIEAEPGRKDHGKIRAFVQAVQSANDGL